MKLTIQLKKLFLTQLIVMEVLVSVLAFAQLTLQAGLIYAIPFTIITVLMVRWIYFTLLLPGCSLKDEYYFSLDKLVQKRKGEKVKEISLGYGLFVYRYAGIMRTSIVFSRKKLPQGELLKAYKNDPEVIYLPYIPRRMPKLQKYIDKATRI